MLATRTAPRSDLDATWFAAWDAAYAAREGASSRAGGLYLVDRAERLGPIPMRVRAGATNVHSILYDAPADVAVDFDALFDHGVDLLRFEYLAEDSRILAAARGYAGRRGVRIAPHAIAPLADCRSDYATWIAARSKRIRSRLNKDTGRATGAMGMTLDFHCGAHDQDLSRLIRTMLAVEQSGWKGRAGSAIADDPADAIFYTALAHGAAAIGALRLATLSHDGRVVAFEYGILFDGRLSVLKVGYDERYADVSLGYVLAGLHIRRCCEDPAIDWYDKMGNGLTPATYKLRFADRLDTLYRVTVYGRGARGRLALAHDRARAWGKAWRDRRRRVPV